MSPSETMLLLRRMIAINMSTTLAYRGEFFFFMFGAVFGPLVSALVWRAAIASGASLPIDRSYLMTYFVLLAVVSMLTSAWLSGFLGEAIRNGTLSVWLARPGSFLYEMAANNISEKAFKSVVLFPMVLAFAWLFRRDISIDAAAWRWLVAASAVLMGAVIAFSLDVAEGSLAFWVDDIGGIVRARGLLMAILAGQVVPLALMPEWAQGFLRAQPFRYILSFPLEVIVADLSRREIGTGLALQALYTVLCVLGARWLWRVGQQSYSAVGA